MARNKLRYPVSLDADIVEKLEGLTKQEFGAGSRMVNRILRDHLDDYIAGKENPGTIDREEIRKILREELDRRQIQPVAGEEVEIGGDKTSETSKQTSIEDTMLDDMLNNFISMRKKD
jgi:hypothetical protein